jgi:hypothetical protein
MRLNKYPTFKTFIRCIHFLISKFQNFKKKSLFSSPFPQQKFQNSFHINQFLLPIGDFNHAMRMQGPCKDNDHLKLSQIISPNLRQFGQVIIRDYL